MLHISAYITIFNWNVLLNIAFCVIYYVIATCTYWPFYFISLRTLLFFLLHYTLGLFVPIHFCQWEINLWNNWIDYIDSNDFDLFSFSFSHFHFSNLLFLSIVCVSTEINKLHLEYGEKGRLVYVYVCDICSNIWQCLPSVLNKGQLRFYFFFS